MTSKSIAEKSAIPYSIERLESGSRMLDFSPQGKRFLPFPATSMSKKTMPLQGAFFQENTSHLRAMSALILSGKIRFGRKSAMPNEA